MYGEHASTISLVIWQVWKLNRCFIGIFVVFADSYDIVFSVAKSKSFVYACSVANYKFYNFEIESLMRFLIGLFIIQKITKTITKPEGELNYGKTKQENF